MDVTYNYAKFYKTFWSNGLLGIYHRKASDVIPELEKAVEALGVECDDDYWKPTPGNAGYALSVLLSWAKAASKRNILGRLTMSFNFTRMLFNYEERKVENTKTKTGAVVDTCEASDTLHPYETAVKHKNYNDNRWIVVEEYDSKDDAIAGHERWVKTMEAEKLPTELKDVSSCGIAVLRNALCGEMTFKNKANGTD